MHARNRRALCGLALLGTSLGVTVLPGPAHPQARAASELEQARAAERAAAAALAESSAAVAAAGAELERVRTALPAAQTRSAQARGALAGATATARAARAAADRRRTVAAAAAAREAAATGLVGDGREAVGLIARQAYQHGPLSDLQPVLDARDPAQALRRSDLLRAVVRHRSAALERLTAARLEQAAARATARAEQRAAEQAERTADAEQARAARLASEAEAAEAAVQALVGERARAFAAAEALRSQDRQEYDQAQRESAALAERIRAAAAAAAARAAAAAAEAARRAAAGRPVPPASGPTSTTSWTWPAAGPVTSRYGYRTHPIYGDRRMHTGIDIGAGSGVPIVAAADGTVLLSERSGGYGLLTVLEHASRGGRSVTTSSAHQSVSYVDAGERVRRGQVIGRVGATGNVTGPHLHFEVRLDGSPVDPEDYVSR